MKRKILILLVIFCALILSSCNSNKDGKFAIYLVAEDVTPADYQRKDMDELSLQSEPFISSEDIVSYNKTDHTIELTREAYDRFQAKFPLPVKVTGINFVVCVGTRRIYSGSLWTPLSSISYDGVVIMQPFDEDNTTIQISLGYPGPEAFTGNDPRSDSRILKALERDNKLISTP